MSEVPVKEGDVLADKYRIERVLGAGGMGVVVAATHVELERRVAIKFLLPTALANKTIVERFAREARIAAQIRSEHVARVVDVGKLDSGAPYLVMEYLEGDDLSHVLETRRQLPIDEAVAYVLEACEALAEAHAMGVVHRDLKPANLFLTTRPSGGVMVKVLDFGISKAPMRTSDEGSLTQTANVMGSPLYMSPEQLVASKAADARSDIWALGVILYELVTGEPPFLADTLAGQVALVVHGAPIAVAGLPPDFARIIERCLHRNPALRYPDVGTLATALAPFGAAPLSTSAQRTVRILSDAPAAPFVAWRSAPPSKAPQPTS